MHELYSGKVVVFLAAMLGIALLLSLSIQLIRPSMRTIAVTASGSASGIPAVAQVYIYANGTGTTSSNAALNLSVTLNTLNSTLMNYVGGNMSNISTDSYKLARINSSKMSYIAVEYLHATVSAQRISSLLGALAGIQNVYVNGEYAMLSTSQSNILRNGALSSAFSNATSQARAIVGQSVALTPTNITVITYRTYPILGS